MFYEVPCMSAFSRPDGLWTGLLGPKTASGQASLGLGICDQNSIAGLWDTPSNGFLEGKSASKNTLLPYSWPALS